jgi:hypothetical protein
VSNPSPLAVFLKKVMDESNLYSRNEWEKIVGEPLDSGWLPSPEVLQKVSGVLKESGEAGQVLFDELKELMGRPLFEIAKNLPYYEGWIVAFRRINGHTLGHYMNLPLFEGFLRNFSCISWEHQRKVLYAAAEMCRRLEPFKTEATWEIASIEQNRFNKEIYIIHLERCERDADGEVMRGSTAMNAQELEPIMKNFNVAKPFDLLGKSFKVCGRSAMANVGVAIHRLKIDIKYDFSYVPPAPEAIFEKMAAAFSKMEEPNLCSEIDFDSICEAFDSQRELYGFGLDESFLDWLMKRVKELSNSLVELQKAAVSEFSERVRNPGAHYMKLVSVEKTQKLILCSNGEAIFTK